MAGLSSMVMGVAMDSGSVGMGLVAATAGCLCARTSAMAEISLSSASVSISSAMDSSAANASSSFKFAPFVGLVVGAPIVQRSRAGSHGRFLPSPRPQPRCRVTPPIHQGVARALGRAQLCAVAWRGCFLCPAFYVREVC